MKEPGASFPLIDGATIPWLTIEQMIEADRLAIDEFHIGLLQMMEHAGSALAELTDLLLPDGPITVLAGGGNNGGGGLCAARHLTNRGRTVEVVIATERAMGPAPSHHLETLAEMGIAPVPWPSEPAGVIDAMVGYGLGGPLRGRAADLAQWTRTRPVVALDFPSGHGFGGVSAAATLTLALPKEGLRDLDPLYLADLGLPGALWSQMGLGVEPVFAKGRIVRIVS